MSDEELENAVLMARGWLDGDTGYDPVFTAVAKALLALHEECGRLRKALDVCGDVIGRNVKLHAELARIRPVFEAACAWRECRASDTRRLMEMVRALTAAIDTARPSSAKRE